MIEESAFEVFWQTYPLDLCTRKGSKAKAKKLWDKLDKPLQKQIIINMREMMRVDRKLKKAGEFVPRWSMVTTWLAGERWEDIADIRQSESMPKTTASQCSTNQCSNDASWQSLCWDCYSKAYPNECMFPLSMLKDRFIKESLLHNESKAERTERCKAYIFKRGYKIGSMAGA